MNPDKMIEQISLVTQVVYYTARYSQREKLTPIAGEPTAFVCDPMDLIVEKVLEKQTTHVGITQF